MHNRQKKIFSNFPSLKRLLKYVKKIFDKKNLFLFSQYTFGGKGNGRDNAGFDTPSSGKKSKKRKKIEKRKNMENKIKKTL